MRSLGIRTQRIFNNLFKKNQKFGSDSVLHQLMTVSVSSVRSPSSKVQRPGSSVQSPASNTWVQGPGIPWYAQAKSTELYMLLNTVQNFNTLENLFNCTFIYTQK